MTLTPYPDAIRRTIIKAALARLDECRAKCPGVGGDVDAMNLRHLGDRIAFDDEHARPLMQAARTLENLSQSLEIDASDEVDALLSLTECPLK